MVSVAYSHRILCDSEFISWLADQQDREMILSHLIHIKSSSDYWKKTHNVILKSEAIECKKNDKVTEKYVGASFKIVDDPEFVQGYTDLITRNIIFGIELTDEPPFRCYIFTSPNKQEQYLSNTHYEGITSIKILSGDKARKIINDFYSAFCVERDNSRT